MKNSVNTYLNRFRRDRRKQLKFSAILAALAAAVAGVVFWQLHTTGVAMTNEVFCGLEEHVHGDGCFEGVLICDCEGEDHVHEDGCFEAVPVCEIQEHTHTAECLIDETADVETAEDWEAALPETLSGVWADDLVAVAQSQVGYTESEQNFRLAGDGETRQGYTRYGAWYGNEYGDWDAMFVSFCLHYAEVPADVVPENSGAWALCAALEQRGLYEPAEDHEAVPGELIFLDNDHDGKTDKVAVVEEVNDQTGGITFIQGDCDGAVARVKTDCLDAAVIGYGILPGQTEENRSTDPPAGDDDPAAAAEITTDEKSETAGALKNTADPASEDVMTARETTREAECEGLFVTVTAPAGAIPEDAELSVSLYDRESETYAGAKEALGLGPREWDGNALVWTGAEDNLLVLDISFMRNGAEVEPKDTVVVTIDAAQILPEDADMNTLKVQHLEEYAGSMEAVVVADTGDEAEGTVDEDTAVAVFSVDSLSPFTVVWSPRSNRTATVTVNVFDLENGSEEISSAEGMYSFTTNSSSSWTATTYSTTLDVETLVAGITLGTGYDDYYAFAYASAVYNGRTSYGDEENPLTSIDMQKTSSSNGATVYTFHYGSSSATQTHSRSDDSSMVTLNLYYRHVEASVKISAKADAGEGHVSGYTLSRTTEHFDTGQPLKTEWSMDPEGLAEMTENNDGTATLVWLDDGQDLTGKSMTVTVTVTGVNKHGNEVSVSDSVMLYYDAARVNTVEIEDDIKYNGDLLAVIKDGNGNEILDHSGLEFVWYISDETGSETDDSQSMISRLLASTAYSKITNEDVFDETDSEELDDDRALNVAREQGGLHAFYVEVYERNDTDFTNCLAKSEGFYVPYAMKLLNGSFEYPGVGSSMQQYDYGGVPYWSTTASDRLIEIVPYSNSDGWGTLYNYRTHYAGGSQAAAGSQFAELNAEQYGALYQDVLTAPGSELTWSCSHRARTSGWSQNFEATNAMYVVMMSENDAEMLLDGVSQAEQQDVVLAMLNSAGGTGIGTDGAFYQTYTLQSGNYAGEAAVTFSAWYETVTTERGGDWVDGITGTYIVPQDQYLTRFFFVAEHGYSPINESDPTVGNLLDLAEFSQQIGWQIDYYVYDAENDTYVLSSTESGTDEVFNYVYAGLLESEYSRYHLLGSVTGSETGGPDPSFDRHTHDYLLLDQNSRHLSLYLMENGAVVCKTLEGFTDEQLAEIYHQDQSGNAGFSLADVTFTVEVGEEGTGLHVLSPLAAGTYTVTETGYAGTLLNDSYIWQKVDAFVDGSLAAVTEGPDGYAVDFELEEFSEIEFINYYVPLLTIQKIDSVYSDETLSGAQFILSRTVTENGLQVTSYYTGAGWAEDESKAEKLTTGETGSVTAALWDFTAGEEAVYTLTEVEAPDGYTLLEQTITFTVENGGIQISGGDGETAADGMTLKVKNEEALYPVTVFKYTESSEGDTDVQGLPGAEFVLSRTDENGVTWYASCTVDSETASWKVDRWVRIQGLATKLTSDPEGYIRLQDLEAGSYLLTETSAPDGYMPLESEIEFTIHQGGSVTVSDPFGGDSYEGVDIAVENVAGTVLPNTGGTGTWLWTAGGLLLIAGAGALLVGRKRRAVKA